MYNSKWYKEPLLNISVTEVLVMTHNHSRFIMVDITDYKFSLQHGNTIIILLSQKYDYGVVA